MSDLIIKISNKNVFATDSLLWLRIVIILQIVFILVLISFILLQYSQEPESVYFPFKKYDNLIEIKPLEDPILTDAELLSWVTEAMIVAFSFNYHNYEKIIEKIEEYFDSPGIDSYLNLIAKTDLLREVVKQKLIVSGRPSAAPRILKDGIVDGRYAWQIELPFTFRYNNQIIHNSTSKIISILAVRTPEQKAPLGVKIVNIQYAVNKN